MSPLRTDRRSPWSLRASSVTGSAHLRHAGGCEDAYAVASTDQALIVAVADGCSSARFAAAGAALAAPLAVTVVEKLLAAQEPPDTGSGWHEFLNTALDLVASEFVANAAQTAVALGGRAAADLASTLVVAVVAGPWVAVLAIGDGTVVIRSGGEHLDLLLPPDSRYEDTSVTTFLTTPEVSRHARRLVGHVPDLDAVAVCTDGMDVATIEFAGGRAVRPAASFYPELFRWAADRNTEEADLPRLLVQKSLSDGTDDDRTIVLAVRAR